VVQKPAVVSTVGNDAAQLANDAAKGSLSLTNETATDAASIAGHAVNAATSIAAPEVNIANQAVRDAGTLTGDAVRGVDGITAHEVNSTTAYVNHDVATDTHSAVQAERAAVRDTNSVQSSASSTTQRTATRAGSDVQATYKTSIQVVKAVEDRVGKGWTLDVSVLGMHTSSQSPTLAPDGTLTVTGTNGETLATARVVNGAATIHFLTTQASANSYTLHYSGNHTYLAAHLPWLSPIE
jgi:hypothetical protein